MKKHCLSFFLFTLMPLTGIAAAAAVQPAATATPAVQPAPQAPAVINCEMHVPKDTKIIAPDLVEHWATQAALQSFHFEATPIAPQLLSLKPCYTDQGWQGFNDAFKKSGNLEAITSRHLTVSSQPKSKITVQVIKDNQWKTSIPLEIIYQNKDQKLTQSLTVDLLINRKASGDLGIMQLIAIPIQAAGASGSTGSIPVKP